jgi:hypothetical protein
MERTQIRKAVAAQFYQSLAESGVEITSLPHSELQALVNAFADGLLAALDALEEEEAQLSRSPMTMNVAQAGSTGAQATPVDVEEEELLWTGKPYLTIGIRYELTTQRLRIIRGLLGRTYQEIELVRVRDTAVAQHVGERALNIGDITIYSNDPSDPEIVLQNVKEPMEVRELIRKATLAEKQRRNLTYREEM